MKKAAHILTVYTTEKGVIKDSVIQKNGKITAHLIASPELSKTTLKNHPFIENIDRTQLSTLCDDFMLERGKKGDVLIKKPRK
ncbi:hypothetical protein MHTCC0001_33560 [Flavobacteriaceae bacterium MHTCC 0001]